MNAKFQLNYFYLNLSLLPTVPPHIQANYTNHPNFSTHTKSLLGLPHAHPLLEGAPVDFTTIPPISLGHFFHSLILFALTPIYVSLGYFISLGSGEGNGNPLQCSCLENPRDRGAWWAAVYGVAQSWTQLKRLSSSSSRVFYSSNY